VPGGCSLLAADLRCLDAHAHELRALGEVLAHADAKTVEKALQASQTLTPIAECADAAGLRAPVRPPSDPVERARVEDLRGKIAEARAFDSAGKFADAVERGKKLVDEARAAHYRPLEATALSVLGQSQRDAGDLAGAQASLEASTTAAIAARDDVTAAEASAVLARVVGYDRAKGADGDPWLERANAFLEAHPDDRVRALLENNTGVVRFGQGRYDEAIEHQRVALAARERLYGKTSPLVAATLDNLGLDYDFRGDNVKGTDFHKQALAIDEAALGPDHPTVALTLTNLAVSLRSAGNLDEALAIAKRALAIKEAVYGPDNAMVGVSLNEIGNIYYFEAKYDDAVVVWLLDRPPKATSIAPPTRATTTRTATIATRTPGWRRAGSSSPPPSHPSVTVS